MLNALSFPWRGLRRQSSISLARGGDGPSREPVLIYRAAHALEGQVVAARLAAAGIPSWQRGESLAAAYGLTMGPLARVDILVPAALEELARAVLSADATHPAE
jgi:hypothetical protein